ncbi:MAG: hypothetical protein GX803_01660 [Lentisphaerae bacterium]|jgi:hypothetical protein|nr:hypothetical protein [Lentisphaerota bacterium]
MDLALSELLHTAGVIVAAYAVLTLLGMFLKAESATWNKPATEEEK